MDMTFLIKICQFIDLFQVSWKSIKKKYIKHTVMTIFLISSIFYGTSFILNSFTLFSSLWAVQEDESLWSSPADFKLHVAVLDIRYFVKLPQNCEKNRWE